MFYRLTQPENEGDISKNACFVRVCSMRPPSLTQDADCIHKRSNQKQDQQAEQHPAIMPDYQYKRHCQINSAAAPIFLLPDVHRHPHRCGQQRYVGRKDKTHCIAECMAVSAEKQNHRQCPQAQHGPQTPLLHQYQSGHSTTHHPQIAFQKIPQIGSFQQCSKCKPHNATVFTGICYSCL